MHDFESADDALTPSQQDQQPQASKAKETPRSRVSASATKSSKLSNINHQKGSVSQAWRALFSRNEAKDKNEHHRSHQKTKKSNNSGDKINHNGRGSEAVSKLSARLGVRKILPRTQDFPANMRCLRKPSLEDLRMRMQCQLGL
jgi:hypothetical protein